VWGRGQGGAPPAPPAPPPRPPPPPPGGPPPPPPPHMAAAFPQALELIRAVGFRYLCVYRRRTPLFCKL